MINGRPDIYPKDDMFILRNAIKMSNRRIKGTPYKYITIKEAMAFIGYPDVSIDVKG